MIPAVSKQDCLAAFRRMLLIRRLEEACIVAGQKGQVPGHYHVYQGQEATGVGVISNLTEGDYVYSTHRNHGHLIARGADPKLVLAEILGKATGTSGGKAGTLHGCAPELNFPLSSGIVAGVLPIAVGTGYALKQRGLPNVSTVMFGEGALEEGAAYEALNIASLWRLPVLLVCENNTAEVERKPGQAIYHAPNMAITETTGLARAMNIRSVSVDGLDLGAVWSAAKEARDLAVAGHGPTFLEVKTWTWPGGQWPSLVTGVTDIRHAWTGEVPEQYAKHASWFKRNDPVLSVARELLVTGIASQADIERMDAEVRKEMADAEKFAHDSPFPDADTALTDVWPRLQPANI